jgi:hypothetical protein
MRRVGNVGAERASVRHPGERVGCINLYRVHVAPPVRGKVQDSKKIFKKVNHLATN